MARKEYKAQDGYTFIKGDKIIGKIIYLGTNDNIDNYIEVSDDMLPKGEIEDAEIKED